MEYPIPAIVTSLLTLLLAAIALFGERIRGWIFKPEISLKTGKVEPYIQNEDGETESEEGADRIQIVRVLVKISKRFLFRSPLTNCKVFIDKVFEKRSNAEKFSELKNLVPTNLLWHTKDTKMDIMPDLPAYFEVVVIRKSKLEPTDNTGKAEDGSRQNYVMHIPTYRLEKLEYMELGRGTFLIPITLCGEKIKSRKYYLEIYWDGKNLNDTRSESNFRIDLHECDEYKGKIIEEK